MVNWKSKYLKYKKKLEKINQKGGMNFNNLPTDMKQMIGMNLSPRKYNSLFTPQDRINWCPNQIMNEKFCENQELIFYENSEQCRKCIDDLIEYYKVKYGPKPYILHHNHKIWTYIGINSSGPYYGTGPGVYIFNDGSVYEGNFDEADSYEEGLYYANDGKVIKGLLDMNDLLIYNTITLFPQDCYDGRSCPEQFILINKKLEKRQEDDEIPSDPNKEQREAEDFIEHPEPNIFKF